MLEDMASMSQNAFMGCRKKLDATLFTIEVVHSRINGWRRKIYIQVNTGKLI